MRTGSIDVGYLPLGDITQVKVIESRGYDVFGYPDFGFNYVTYNFADTTGDFNNIIAQLYIRQALAHLEDEQGYIKAFFGGAGGLAYGPIPSVPRSPFTPVDAVTDPYPFSVADAISLLKSHGWTVSTSGTDTCAKAGTGPGECGAGIPAGTKLAFNLIYVSYPVIGEEVTDLASEAASAGITIHLQSSNFDYVITNYDNPVPADKPYIDKWAMVDFGGFSDSAYPTTARGLQRPRRVELRQLQQPDGEHADQRVGDQRQPGCCGGGGIVSDREPAGPVPAELRHGCGVEEKHLGSAGLVREPDPVLPQS